MNKALPLLDPTLTTDCRCSEIKSNEIRLACGCYVSNFREAHAGELLHVVAVILAKAWSDRPLISSVPSDNFPVQVEHTQRSQPALNANAQRTCRRAVMCATSRGTGMEHHPQTFPPGYFSLPIIT